MLLIQNYGFIALLFYRIGEWNYIINSELHFMTTWSFVIKAKNDIKIFFC
ncbi:hypothetical protein J2X17_000994 [Flavobacterium aquidurense]|nr:hypothetical protein [Flavobacterium aquidurense]